MERKVREFIEKEDLLTAGDRVILAFSGGPDSMFMLHILYRLREELGIDLILCHLNHNLRAEESLRDEMFSRRVAEEYGLPIAVRSLDISSLAQERKESIETTARNERYRFFQEMMGEHDAQVTALAHNMNDQAETVLQRLMRGAGLKGLKGIQPRRGRFIRPILSVTREDIEKYLKENGIESVTDSTNLTNEYSRNRVRHDIIPYIEEHFNPAFVETVYSTSQSLKEDEDLIRSLVSETYDRVLDRESSRGDTLVFKEELKDIHPAIVKRLLLMALRKITESGKDIYGGHLQDILDILQGGTGRSIDLPYGIHVRNSYGSLIIRRKNDSRSPENDDENSELMPSDKEVTLKVLNEPQSVIFDRYTITLWRMDSDARVRCDHKLRSDGEEFLTIRTRREGDRMKPLGMSGTRRIKSILIDRKVDREIREHLPLIMDEAGEIIYLHEGIISEDRKVTPDSKEIIAMNITDDSADSGGRRRDQRG